LGTEAAAQLNLNVFRKETTIADNKRAVKLLRDHGILAEVQFIMGLSHETPETIEETYRMAETGGRHGQLEYVHPLALCRTLPRSRRQVEVRDFSHYNFVTPSLSPTP
jgi:anaerobic magnesium-protoporphyrin IX monomethyl ester cyclase